MGYERVRFAVVRKGDDWAVMKLTNASSGVEEFRVWSVSDDRPTALVIAKTLNAHILEEPFTEADISESSLPHHSKDT